VGTPQTVWAFITVSVVFAGLLVAASLSVASITAETLRPIRMTGPTVRRWSGFILLIVGAWFVVLAALRTPILGS